MTICRQKDGRLHKIGTGGVKVTENTTVTEPGLAAADARQLNAAVKGTVAHTAQEAGSRAAGAAESIRGNIQYMDFTGEITDAVKNALDSADFSLQRTKNFQISDESGVRYVTLSAVDIGGDNFVGWAAVYGASHGVWFVHYQRKTRALEYFEIGSERKTA